MKNVTKADLLKVAACVLSVGSTIVERHSRDIQIENALMKFIKDPKNKVLLNL